MRNALKPQMVKATYEGRTYEIPDLWLMGNSQRHRIDGHDIQESLRLAIATWAWQTELAEQYERQQAETAS